jgi:hypothetical protein
MAADDPVFGSFSDFSTDGMFGEVVVSRRVLRRLEDVDNSTTPGPTISAARAALASSVLTHAAVELEAQIIKLEKQLAQAK